MRVFDNLSGTSPVDVIAVSGSPLTFTYTIASGSSFTFTITSEAPSTPALGPKGIAGLFLLFFSSALCLLVRRDRRR